MNEHLTTTELGHLVYNQFIESISICIFSSCYFIGYDPMVRCVILLI